MIISTNNIIQIARKWQRQWGKTEKGQFVVYSMDKKRFVLPLVYLKNNIFRELFKLAEEEFGHSSNVPLTLPCDAMVIKYTLIQRNVAKDVDEAMLISIATCRCQSYLQDLYQEGTSYI